MKPSSVSWIVTGYSILYALGSLLFGKLADCPLHSGSGCFLRSGLGYAVSGSMMAAFMGRVGGKLVDRRGSWYEDHRIVVDGQEQTGA